MIKRWDIFEWSRVVQVAQSLRSIQAGHMGYSKFFRWTGEACLRFFSGFKRSFTVYCRLGRPWNKGLISKEKTSLLPCLLYYLWRGRSKGVSPRPKMIVREDEKNPLLHDLLRRDLQADRRGRVADQLVHPRGRHWVFYWYYIPKGDFSMFKIFIKT